MSVFDQVYASCQGMYAQHAQSRRSGGWEPPDGFRSACVFEKVEEREGIDKNQVPYSSLTMTFRVLDGEHFGKTFTQDAFLSAAPREGFNPNYDTLCKVASCLAGRTIDDLRSARDILKASSGAAVEVAAKAKPHKGKVYINVYFNKRLDVGKN